MTGFWVALGEGGRAQIAEHLGRYLNWLEPSAREHARANAGFTGKPGELRDRLRALADLGADEVHLVPTCGDPDEVDRLADAIG